MQFSTLLALLSAVAPFAAADCCSAVGYSGALASNGQPCADGTKGTPCCGYGSCNAFCCACNGGCRTASAKRDSGMLKVVVRDQSNDAEDVEAFNAATAGGTEPLTVQRYTSYMNASADDQTYVDWFNKHDKNGDGVLSLDEVRLD
ncbi:uncharacterized protein BKCO1_1420002 [Diplodia corticola]|uniref:EF-hand domain-containing protein n=1 Tax=Diplodia corticola TaxID=236234 RepID=A0A1J9QKM8_9PEZI|nr:uncharacterized protein BKCO1_1420002 [Diplodia corticola]OJD28618.1 hypothetical protein BKCO1_1420002 [Diplodia corticola]